MRNSALRRSLATASVFLLPWLALAQPNPRPQSPLRPWREYRTIMWLGDTAYQQPEKIPVFFQRLREMGINTGMVHGDAEFKPLLENHFEYYVENVVNRGLCLKWNSNVRDWDKFVTGWTKSGRPESALVRDYCLDDPQWLDSARKDVRRIVGKNRPQAPWACNLRDELSTTVSANPFDYDFSPLALAKFRTWLQTQYTNLAVLNIEWETSFHSWDEVKPFTTDQIKNRMASGDSQPHGVPDWQRVQALKFDPVRARQSPTSWNFSPWADFRTYMDISLARALNELRRTAHEVDPTVPVGIEGTQMPSAFGGYDLWRLSQALDWVEPYDIGSAREIFGSFMPGRPLLTTVFEADTNHARRRLWHLLLEGDRGCIVWWSEDCIDWKSADYQLTPKAKALAPVLKEMTSSLARVFLLAEPERDPIFIHYSQPSIQADWLLESTADGSTWLRRFSSFEAGHNQQAKVRNGWLKLFQDLGYSPRFISSNELERGAWGISNQCVLVLPQSWALSDKEMLEVVSFPNKGGSHRLFVEGPAGAFDAHGKLRRRDALEQVLPASLTATQSCVALGHSQPTGFTKFSAAQYAAARLNPASAPALEAWVSSRLKSMPPPVAVPVAARVRTHRFKAGFARLLAFERNVDYQMSEDLKQAGGNEALEKPIEIEADLGGGSYVYDLRTQTYLGHLNHIHFTLDPWQPSLFALLSEKIPQEIILGALDVTLTRGEGPFGPNTHR